MAVIFDTETTGLLEPLASRLEKQPAITEIYCRKIDDETGELGEVYQSLVNPQRPIPEKITEITGIRDEDVKDAPTFAQIYPALADYFCGEKVMVAHNLSFDRDMLAVELRRIGKEYHFPWPRKHICTVEQTEHWRGHRLKLAVLHEIVMGEGFEGAHRAENDVEALVSIVRKCWKNGEWNDEGVAP